MIMFYRYLMVCQAHYCLAKGEKTIRENLVKFCFAVPLLFASLTMLYLDKEKGSIMCNGREEIFKFNINNFLDEVSHNEIVILLPLHHPYRILSLILGKNKSIMLVEVCQFKR